MPRCKHGIFLPENPKYKAEDVCAICKGLPDTSLTGHDFEEEEELDVLDAVEFLDQPLGLRLKGNDSRNVVKQHGGFFYELEQEEGTNEPE
jgi:hypothetical protein